MASSAKKRNSKINRKTKETDIKIKLCIDGSGKSDIRTGVPFMDHMLTLFATHGFFDLSINASGDTEIDGHHTVEDLGICLGQAIKESLGNFSSIKRYGFAAVPMDEALVRVTLDLSNRPYLYYGLNVPDQKSGDFDTALTKEFFRAMALNAGMTLHLEMPHGENTHHILEAGFKALGRALDQATGKESRALGRAVSSKGSL